MQVCISLQTDNHASTPPLKFFTGRMPFLPPNQQRQNTEGATYELPQNIYSAIQILTVCTVVFFIPNTHTHVVHTALVCSILMQESWCQQTKAVGKVHPADRNRKNNARLMVTKHPARSSGYLHNAIHYCCQAVFGEVNLLS